MPACFSPMAMPTSPSQPRRGTAVLLPSAVLWLSVRGGKSRAPCRASPAGERRHAENVRSLAGSASRRARPSHRRARPVRGSWAAKSMSCGTASMSVPEVAEALPVPFQPFGQHRMGMSSTPSIRLISRSWFRPHRREADAAIAEDRRGDAMERRGREAAVPGRLAVIMVWMSTKRGDDASPGVDFRPPAPGTSPTATIRPLETATSPSNGADPCRRKSCRCGRRGHARLMAFPFLSLMALQGEASTVGTIRNAPGTTMSFQTFMTRLIRPCRPASSSRWPGGRRRRSTARRSIRASR